MGQVQQGLLIQINTIFDFNRVNATDDAAMSPLFRNESNGNIRSK